MRRLLAIAFLVLLCGSASAQSVRFPSVAVGTSAAGPEITGWLYRPTGAGPFPAIVLAHPCSGVSEHTSVWGKLLASWGYVVVAPDSFGPRGEKSVCGRGNVVNGNMRVADVAGAIDFLNAQPFVRRGDIGLIGHSHGGWTAVRAVQKSYGLAARGLKAAVAYYPSCQQQFDRNVDVPLLILIGDKDDWTPADNCRKLQAAGFTRPDLVEAVYYPNAYHSFDSKAADRTITVADGKSHRLAYDASAAPDAEARTRAFFAKYLRAEIAAVLRWLLAAAIVASAGGAAAEPVSFRSITFGNSAAAPEIQGAIYSPAGPGPWPAIVVMHGCGGVSTRTSAWGKRLADWGYLALVLDSFGARGVKAVCTTPGVVTPNMRVADVAGAIDFLAQRADVVKGHFGLIGFSHGGSTAIRATQKSFDLARRGLVASAAYYPGCNPTFDREVDVPLLILIGDKDDWTRADRCRTLQASGFVKPDLVEAIYYPDAVHAFDSNVKDRTVAGSGGKLHLLAYDPVAAPDAEARTKAFFARYLSRP